jgi:RNA polymerase sigma-70 factor, ECF subfamily
MLMPVPQALGLPGHPSEEALLVARAQESDRAAWDEIFERYYRRVYVFVYCRTGDSAAAEDLTSDVFIEAWKGIRRFTYRGVSLLSWLYRIAHNLLADFHKKRSRARTESLDAGRQQPADGRDEAEQVAMWQSVASAMRKLTLEQQQVLVSRFVEGLSLSETAGLMGKSENAVKALEFRALKSVRRFLGEPALTGKGAA